MTGTVAARLPAPTDKSAEGVSTVLPRDTRGGLFLKDSTMLAVGYRPSHGLMQDERSQTPAIATASAAGRNATGREMLSAPEVIPNCQDAGTQVRFFPSASWENLDATRDPLQYSAVRQQRNRTMVRRRSWFLSCQPVAVERLILRQCVWSTTGSDFPLVKRQIGWINTSQSFQAP